MREARWLILALQLAAKPAYGRVKIWRRLQDIGALGLKNSVYVLPASDESRAQFARLLKEIERGGGEGVVCEASLVAGMRDDQMRALFNAARDKDYHTLTIQLRALAQEGKKAKKRQADPAPVLARIGQRLSHLREIDFFAASGRAAAEALLAELEHGPIRRTAGKPGAIRSSDMAGKVWVTRQDVHVDRIACAWLIGRFIDPRAKFKFVKGKSYVPRPGEYRYDMQDGEFTHEGDKCSFEVLLERAAIRDLALGAIGEIIHDIDLKDGKFGRPETSGIAHVIAGICRTQGEDDARLARGRELFDDVYEQFSRSA